jgi:hypothetical protein
MDGNRRPPVPLTEAGGQPDWVREMHGLLASHPTLDWLKPSIGIGPHVAVWEEDDGTHREVREELRDLVLYLRARLGSGK